jgi:hypothetical protein
MFKRRTILGIVSCVAIMVLAWSGLMARGSATTVNDPQNDVGGGKIVADIGSEHYNVTCGNPPAAPSLDIKAITWFNNTVNYTIVIEFWNPIDIVKLTDGDIWGGIEFSVNGSAIEDNQLVAAFTGAVATWTVYERITYGNVANCAINASTTITWTFAKTFLDIIPGVQNINQWVVRAYVMYVSIETSDVAWDEYNYSTYPETHGITCVTGGPSIPGYDLMLVGLVMVVSSMVAARILLNRVRKSC